MNNSPNPTGRATAALAKLREIAECKGVSDGLLGTTEVGLDIRDAQKHLLAETNTRGCDAVGFRQAIRDTSFIARSRTITPALAKALIVGIEGLAEVDVIRQAMAESGHDFFVGGAQRSFPLLCNAYVGLNSILEIVEAL